MSRLVPYPLLAVALAAMWLLLNGLSAGQLLLAAAVAMLIPQAMRALRPQKPRIRWSWAIARLAGLVLVDIVRSNIAVGRIVLFGPPERRSGFMHLPLDLSDRYGLATLAIILTATPGTLWAQHDAERNQLLIHVLDLVDEETWVTLIKHRYERLLMEIFE